MKAIDMAGDFEELDRFDFKPRRGDHISGYVELSQSYLGVARVRFFIHYIDSGVSHVEEYRSLSRAQNAYDQLVAALVAALVFTPESMNIGNLFAAWQGSGLLGIQQTIEGTKQ